MLVCKNFTVLHFTFMFVIPLRLIFFVGVKSIYILLCVCMWMSSFSTGCQKYGLTPWYHLHSCQISSIYGLSLLYLQVLYLY